MTPKRWQTSIFYMLLLLAVFLLISTFQPFNRGPVDVPFYTMIDQAKQNQIDTIRQEGDTVTGLRGDKEVSKSSFVGGTNDLIKTLQDQGVTVGDNGLKIDVIQPSNWGSLIVNLLFPILLFGGLIFFFMRSARGANSQAFNFGRSRARLFTGNKQSVTFADVAGVDEVKQEVAEIVEFLKSPQKFHALGARVPRGVLLVGSPGSGKTLLARAIAGEAGVPFFSISGSEFVEMFVGVGAARVRDLFEQAKRSSPCIVFVDEIDAVGRHRGAGLGGGHDEREQTLNQILVEMDGFDTNTSIIILAATNRPDILDPALLRPGRFDRQIVIDLPDINGRKAILEVHSKGKPIEKGVDLGVIAKQTPGFSGADLANLINEASILAARRDRKDVSLQELEDSIDRVIAGPDKKSRLISPKEKEIIAYHEVGHALAARMMPNADPVHKITIVSRGLALGWTRFLPTEDRHLWSKAQFVDRLVVSLAGRAAEEIAFNEVTTGARDDLEKATKLARSMVTEYGMSDDLGPRTFGKREELVFLGREITEQRNYSEKVAEQIDSEVRRLVDDAHQTARRVILENKNILEGMAQRLIAKETLDEADIEALYKELQSSQNPPEPASAPAA